MEQSTILMRQRYVMFVLCMYASGLRSRKEPHVFCLLKPEPLENWLVEEKRIRELYIFNSSLGEIVSFYDQKHNYLFFIIFLAVLFYYFLGKEMFRTFFWPVWARAGAAWKKYEELEQLKNYTAPQPWHTSKILIEVILKFPCNVCRSTTYLNTQFKLSNKNFCP